MKYIIQWYGPSVEDPDGGGMRLSAVPRCEEVHKAEFERVLLSEYDARVDRTHEATGYIYARIYESKNRAKPGAACADWHENAAKL